MKSFLPLIRSEWRLLLFGFAMAFASSQGQTYFIGLFSGEIRMDLRRIAIAVYRFHVSPSASGRCLTHCIFINEVT